ncbi:MAG: flagellar hook-basal body complex protein FliE [Hyphomicrobiales bacterium]|nr:MAG: flagellar hook-basal body complex protein FliE [Hyphomicrobiales bacterium]
MTIPSIAANAYTSVQRLGSQGQGAGLQTPAAGQGKNDFASMVTEAVQGVAETGAATEAKEMAMLGNKADVVDVVTAVAETELALETLVSVRDKVIAAYQQIMQMPI